MDQPTQKVKDKPGEPKSRHNSTQSQVGIDFSLFRNMRALRTSLIPSLNSEEGVTLEGVDSNGSNGKYPLIKSKSIQIPEPGVSSSSRNGKPRPLLRAKTDGFIKVSFPEGPLKEEGDEFEALTSTSPSLIREENLKEALLTLVFALFTPVFSLIAGFWHIYEDLWSEGIFTLGILLGGGFLIQITFLMNRGLEKKKIWKTDKCLVIFSAIPIILPIIMAIKNLYFSLRETRSPRYTRPWGKTQIIFLVESLAIAFPQSIYQLVHLIQIQDDLFIAKGIFLGVGILTLPAYMAFARMKYDSQNKQSMFGGSEIEVIIRGIVLYTYKIIWVIDYALIIVCFQIMSVGELESYVATCLAILTLLISFEFPVFVYSIKGCMKFTRVCQGIFFFYPQFMALGILIVWVNVDSSVYATFTGISVLGSFFWAEMILMTGWLLDACTGVEMDFNLSYPHLFGSFYVACNS